MTRMILTIMLLLAPVGSAASETIRVGDKAPSFSLPDLYGRRISLDFFDEYAPDMAFLEEGAEPHPWD